MKNNKINYRPLLLGAVLTVAACLSAGAATYTKVDNTNSLTDPISWGGTVPGSGDIAQWSGIYLTTNSWTLGASTNWSGIQILPASGVTIANDGNALTLGASGIDLSLATNNLTINPSLILETSQNWNVTNGRTLSVGGVVSDGGNVYGLTKTGAGTVNLYNANTFTGPVLVNAGTLAVSTNSTSNGSLNAAATVTVNSGGNFTVNPGGTVNGQVYVKTNTTLSSINCTVNGTIVGNATTDPAVTNGVAIPLTPQNAIYTPAAPFGYVNVNGGGSLAAGGYVTNNGVVKFSGSDTSVTFGTFIMPNGLGGIWDANRTAKTFTFPNGSALAYFKCDSNEVSTLQIAGNGSAYIKWLGYNDANAAGAQLWSYTNTFNGGTWTIGYIGQNNSACHYVGAATLTGGANMTVTNNANFAHGTWNIINGSLTFNAQLAETHPANNAGLNISVNNSGGGAGSLIVTNGGFNLGFATANTGPENNSLNVTNGGTASIKGTFQLGTTTASPNAETNSVNLAGGKLVVNGTIQSAAVAGAQDRVFNWTGGQLSAQTITTGAGFNDPASSISSSTVSNTAGVLAPGDIGTAGRTTITGGYVQTAGGTLAIDIGGTYQSGNVFQAGPTNYDFVSVSGSANVAGLITANLVGGYTPTATTAFTVLTGTGGLVANSSTLGYGGYIPVYTNGVLFGGKYFQALVAGNNLILTNYGVSVPALAAKFSPTNAIGVAPATPTFTDTSTGVITNRHWDFGDGNTLDTTATSVPHTYSVVGIYTVTLTIYALDGSTSTATGTVKATLSADNALWKGGLSGNIWDLTTANWFTNGVTGAYHDPDFATFDDSGNAASPVNVSILLQPSSVTFSNVTKNYTLSGSGSLSGNSSLTLAGDGVSSGGNVTLLTTNNYTGGTIVNFGALQVGNGTADGGIDSSTNLTIGSGGAAVFNQNSTHSLAASLVGSGSLTKSGSGMLILSGDNSANFSGPVTITGGTLDVASDSTLGLNGGTVNLTNATLQISSGGTLNRNLNLGGTNVSLNVNGTVILPNVINGLAPVTVGGGGTLQIDNGGSFVSLPTNVVLNGGSLAYNRSDTYAQPGVISASSASSSVVNNSTSAGNTNTLTFANGINIFNLLYNNSGGVFDLNGSANSTNYIAGTTGGAFGVNSTAAGGDLNINGGNYFITNAPLFGTIGGGNFASAIVLNGGSLVSSYYGSSISASDGGARFIRCNLIINGGTFRVTAWGLGFNDSGVNNPVQSFTLNSGTVLVDDSSTLAGAAPATGPTFYGLVVGSHDGANSPKNFGNALCMQNGGSLILSGSTNNNFDLGCPANSPTNKVSSYTLGGGTLSIVGGANGGNIRIGGSADGLSTGTLILTNTGKLIASGSIFGYGGAAGSQVFTIDGGTLVASNVNMSALADIASDPVGTLVNNGGTLSPGDAGVAGQTTITGNYTMNGGSLAMDVNGGAPANSFTNSGAFYDYVSVSGAVTLGGNLVVSTNGAYVPTKAAYTILTAASVSGNFANALTSGSTVTVQGSSQTFQVLYTPTSVILTNFSGAGSAPSVAPTNVVAKVVNIGGINNIVLSGNGGGGSSGYSVLSTTNLTLPRTGWITNATGVPFGPGGSIAYTNPVSSVMPARFFQIRVP